MGVGQRIKSIRQGQGMTLKEFGDMFGASKGNVHMWESGSVIPSNDRLKYMAEIAGISVDELLHGNHLLKDFSNEELMNEIKRRINI